ncbi:MAG: tetratricopeptide repeat protein [Pseudomonadota bacterium]
MADAIFPDSLPPVRTQPRKLALAICCVLATTLGGPATSYGQSEATFAPEELPEAPVEAANPPAATTDPVGEVEIPALETGETPLSPEESAIFESMTDEDGPVPDDERFGQIGELRVDRFEARQVFTNYMVAEQYPEAVEAAATGLELARTELGDGHIDTVPYITDLGNALLRNGQPGEARIQFEKSITVLRDKAGIFHEDLVEPLTGLGLAFQDMAEHDQAIDSFNYAQHVTHRVEGVYNLDQVRIIEATASSFAAQERWLEAENLQLLIYKLYRRNFGDGSDEALPGMYRLARWYQQVQDYRQSRVIYRRAIKNLSAKYGEDSPKLIPALKGIAGAYLEENGPDAIKGLRASEEILAIMNANPDEFSLEQRILAHLEMGDWFVQFNRSEESWSQYRAGWELAQSDLTSDRDWIAYFDRPHLIYPGAKLGLEVIGYGRVGDEVYYDFEFTIARSGRPEEIQIIGTNLHGQTRGVALQAFRFARFRPRIVDGATVATPGYKVRRVYPTDAPPGFGQAQVGGQRG